MSEIRILSIDGGGIRGIIPAIVLAEFEKRLNKPIASQFNLRAGASTGGIIQTLLSPIHGAPIHTAQTAVDLYENHGPEIFYRSEWHKIESADGLARAKYETEAYEKMLLKEFGGSWLSDIDDDVLIPSYDIVLNRDHLFKTWAARGEQQGIQKNEWDFKLFDVIRAATAAPTYFKPHICSDRTGSHNYQLIDGGIYANNPGTLAYSKAVKTYGTGHDYFVLSLGTGKTERPIGNGRRTDWGIVQWLPHILTLNFNASSQLADIQMDDILGTNYVRIQTDLKHHTPDLPPPNDDMDDASPKNIARLRARAEELVQTWSNSIDDLCEHFDKVPVKSKEELLKEAGRSWPAGPNPLTHA